MDFNYSRFVVPCPIEIPRADFSRSLEIRSSCFLKIVNGINRQLRSPSVFVLILLLFLLRIVSCILVKQSFLFAVWIIIVSGAVPSVSLQMITLVVPSTTVPRYPIIPVQSNLFRFPVISPTIRNLPYQIYY